VEMGWFGMDGEDWFGRRYLWFSLPLSLTVAPSRFPSLPPAVISGEVVVSSGVWWRSSLESLWWPEVSCGFANPSLAFPFLSLDLTCPVIVVVGLVEELECSSVTRRS